MIIVDVFENTSRLCGFSRVMGLDLWSGWKLPAPKGVGWCWLGSELSRVSLGFI